MSTLNITTAVPSASAIHADATRLPIQDVVCELLEGLGAKMVATMANKKNEQTVSAWASGTTTPPAKTEERLRDILHVFRLIRTVDSVHTTRAWFVGKNPNLGYHAPAIAIADGQILEAINAANAFVNS